MYILLYLSMFFVPLGSKVIGLSFGPVQLSPYRICILLAFVYHLFISRGRIRVEGKGVTGYSKKFMLVWLLYAGISFIWANDFSAWIRSMLFLLIGTISLFLYIDYFKSINELVKAAVCFELGVLIQSLIGWSEVLTRTYRFIDMGTSISDMNYRNYIASSYRVPIAMQTNPNNFALLMYVAAFIALLLFVNSEKRKNKILALIMFANCTLLAFLTISRAVILGLFISIFFLMLYVGKKRLSALAGIGCILALVLPYALRYVSSFMSFTFNVVNGSDSVRVNLIKVSLSYLMKTLGFGVGAGQIDYWLGAYSGPLYTQGITNVHNWWAEVLSNYGVLIFAGYLVFYFGAFLALRKRSKIMGKQDSMSCHILSSLLIGFVLASTSPSSLANIEWFWIFMSFLIAFISYLEVGAGNEFTSIEVQR